MRKRKNVYKTVVKRPGGMRPLGDVSVDERIILKQVVKKQGVRM
jgi:hypothetical protein